MKAEQTFFKYYKDLPQWAKGVVIVGGVAISALVAYTVIKKIKAASDAAKAKRNLKNASVDLKNLIKQGIKPSYPNSQYNAWVSQLVSQFDGCDFSATFYSNSIPFASDSFMVLAKIIKQLNNDADWLTLVQTYSIKKFDQCGWGTGDFEGDLYSAITNELSTKETSELNKILQTRNISYRVS